MADFKQAVEWMKEGKKVTRPTWAIDEYIYEPKITLLDNEDKPCDWLRIIHFEATDWEIYQEEDNWSLPKSKIYYNVKYDDGDREWEEEQKTEVYFVKDIETLKEKIIDDFRSNCFVYDNDGATQAIDEDKLYEILDKRFGF